MMPPNHLAQAIADNVPAILVYLDSGLRVLFASGHCRQLLGYAPREILGRSLSEMFDAGTLRYALGHAEALTRGSAVPYEYVLRHKDGSPRHFQVHAIAERDPEGRGAGYFACASDNSGARARRAALRLQDAREAFAAGAASLSQSALARFGAGRAGPELRTPLASIIAALELLREGIDRGSGPDRDGFVALALENADRLSALIDELVARERG